MVSSSFRQEFQVFFYHSDGMCFYKLEDTSILNDKYCSKLFGVEMECGWLDDSIITFDCSTGNFHGTAL